MATDKSPQEEASYLESLDKELRFADAEFEHQQRRYRDQLERSGTDRAFAADAKRIAQNRAKIEKERAEIAERLSALNAGSSIKS